MLTLEKFEEASEIVKRVTRPTKLIYSEYLSESDRGKGLFETGKYAVHRCIQIKRSLLQDQHTF